MSIFLFWVNSAYSQKLSEINEYAHALKLFDNKYYEAAIAQFRQFIIDHPESPKAGGAQFKIGESFFLTGNYESAFQELEKFTIKYYNSPEIEKGWLLKAEALEKLGKLQKAAEVYILGSHFLFEKDNPASECLLRGGKIYYKLGNTEKAKECFNSIILNYRASKNYLQAKLELGKIFCEEKKFKDCIKITGEVIKFASDDNLLCNALLLRGEAYLSIDNLKNAARDFQQILRTRKISPDISYKAFLGVAKIYLKKGEPDNAITYINSYLKARNVPDFIRGKSLVELGNIHLSLGNYKNSERSYLRAFKYLKEKDVSIKTHFNLGISFKNNNKIDEASNQFKKILTKVENDSLSKFPAKVLIELLKLSILKKDLRKANNFLDNIYKYENRLTPEMWMDIVKSFENAGYYSNASNVLEKAIKKFSRKRIIDELIFYKGKLYEEAKQYDKALETYKILIKDFPGDTPAEKAKTRLDYINRIYSFKTENEKFDEEVRIRRKLIALIGKPDELENITLQLGKFYIDFRRDYQKAIEECKQIFPASKSRKIKEESNRILAESYDNLASISLINGDSSLAYSLYDSALFYYHTYINSFPVSKFREKAIIRTAEIGIIQAKAAGKGISEIENVWNTLLEDPGFKSKDYVLMKLGNLYFRKGNLSKSFEKYKGLIKKYKDSQYVDECIFKIGFINYNDGRYDEAENYFRNYIRRYPQGFYSPQVRYYLARTLLKKGKAEESKIILEELISDFYYSVYSDSASLWVGESYFKQGEFKKALERFMEFKQKVLPDSKLIGNETNYIAGIPTRLFLEIGILYDSLGEYKNSINELNTFINLEKENSEKEKGIIELANVLYKAGEKEKALEYFKRIRTTSLNEEYRNEAEKKIANIYFELGKFNTALKAYENLIKKSTSLDDRMIFTAQKIVCLYKSGNIISGDRGVRKFEREFANGNKKIFYEESARFRLENGKAKLKKNNPRRALVAFREVVTKWKNSKAAVEAEYLKGLVLYQLNEFDEAINTLESYPKKFPRSPFLGQVYNTLGKIYSSFNRHVYAYMALKKAAEDSLLGRNRLILKNYITSCLNAGYYDERMKAIRKYLKLFPDADDFFQKKIDLGITYYLAGEYEEGIKYLRSLLPQANSREEVEIQFYIGECYFDSKMFAKALAEYLKIRFYEKNLDEQYRVTTLERIARCYEQLKKFDKALRFYREIVRFESPNTVFGREANKRIKIIQELIKK